MLEGDPVTQRCVVSRVGVMCSVLCALLATDNARAEFSNELPPPPPPLREPALEQLEKMREMRGRLLREGVKLDEAGAKAVEKVLESFDVEQRQARKEVHQARTRLHQMLGQDVDDSVAYQEAIERLRAAHETMHRIKERRFDALLSVLSPKKTARLLVMLGKLHHERRRHPRRRGPRPGP